MNTYSLDSQEDLLDLANEYGIALSYTDGVGTMRRTASDTLSLILTAMGIRADSRETITQSLAEARRNTPRKLVKEVVVISEGDHTPSLQAVIPLGAHQLQDVSLSWTIMDEHDVPQTFSCRGSSCQVIENTVIEQVPYVHVRFRLQTSLSMGYYWVSLSVSIANDSLTGKSFLIVAPRQSYIPKSPSRSFGVSVQLYNLRTTKNWGIGDFRDLKDLLTWAAKDLKAITVGISPLHDPAAGVISPYSPSTRLFFNPLFLDIEAIQEFRSTSVIQRRFRSQRFQKSLATLRASSLVQYDRVRALKVDMLERVYRAFQEQHVRSRTSRFRVFENYCRTRGESLERYCLFQVLSERFGTSVWRQWPAEYRVPHSQQVGDFLQTCQNRLQYFQYVQWQCEEQLEGLVRKAKRLKLAYTLYHDLPVGVHPDGADAWMFQEELALGITLGAPPDSFNLQGQNWGLTAPVPRLMRAAGYRFFIESIRRNMRYGGMLRIDHALGLFRIFVIPQGHTGETGTYIKMPVDEILAILAIESVKSQVMIVGEDLGAVTPEIRTRLTSAGLLSYRLMPFEKTRTGKFRTPKQYPKQAMVSFTTHDLPTLIGYWAGRDIEIKLKANLYRTDQQIEQDLEARRNDRVAFIQALVKEGLLPKKTLKHIPEEASFAFVKAAYIYLARTPCRILMIPLEDLLGEFEAPNLPGAAMGTYPSWQLRLSKSFQAFRHESQILSMVRRIQAYR